MLSLKTLGNLNNKRFVWPNSKSETRIQRAQTLFFSRNNLAESSKRSTWCLINSCVRTTAFITSLKKEDFDVFFSLVVYSHCRWYLEISVKAVWTAWDLCNKLSCCRLASIWSERSCQNAEIFRNSFKIWWNKFLFCRECVKVPILFCLFGVLACNIGPRALQAALTILYIIFFS